MHVKTQNWQNKKFPYNGVVLEENSRHYRSEEVASLLEERDKELQQIDSLKSTRLSCGCEVMKVTLCDKHAGFIKLEEKK